MAQVSITLGRKLSCHWEAEDELGEKVISQILIADYLYLEKGSCISRHGDEIWVLLVKNSQKRCRKTS